MDSFERVEEMSVLPVEEIIVHLLIISVTPEEHQHAKNVS